MLFYFIEIGCAFIFRNDSSHESGRVEKSCNHLPYILHRRTFTEIADRLSDVGF